LFVFFVKNWLDTTFLQVCSILLDLTLVYTKNILYKIETSLLFSIYIIFYYR